MHRSRITSYTMLHTCSKFIQTKKQEFGSNMKQPSNFLTSSSQPIFVLPESSLDLHPSPPHLWRALKNVKRPSCPVKQWSCGRESWTSTEGRFLVPWIGWRQTLQGKSKPGIRGKPTGNPPRNRESPNNSIAISWFEDQKGLNGDVPTWRGLSSPRDRGSECREFDGWLHHVTSPCLLL